MKRIEAAYLISVCVVALALAAISLQRFSALAGWNQETVVAESMGKPRTVDSQQIRLLIKQNKLSGRQAEFYTSTPAAVGREEDPAPQKGRNREGMENRQP